MPANIVIYDRNARFNKHKISFSRKFRPIVEKWSNYKVGRVEIQTFTYKSNNRKTNPPASVLNAMEILKIKAPGIFDLMMEVFQNCLYVITIGVTQLTFTLLTCGSKVDNYYFKSD